jgi:haloacid dehalogenase-like hydrolase
MVAEHPELREQEPLKSVLAGDPSALAASGETNVAGLLGSSHAGMPLIEYEATVSRWLETSRHPRFDRPYTRLVYQPMIELLTYLRANGFKTFIVSGGDVDFMRTFAERVYGIPPDQVVGSTNKKQYQLHGDLGVLIRSSEMVFVDDHEGKPVGISTFIGRRPILAFGNSDGDQQMLAYTDSGVGPRLMLLVHHDDAEREYAYDRQSHAGKLDTALDEAQRRDWVVVSMKDDWQRVFP